MDIKIKLLKRFSGTVRMAINFAAPIFFTFFLIGCALSHSFLGNKMKDRNTVITEGVYECNSIDYSGLAIISRMGDVYQIKWQLNKQIFNGIGIREDNILSASWFDRKGAIGIVVYKIEPGPILRGKYSIFSGDGTIKTETLTFKSGLAPSDNESYNQLEI